MADEMGVPMSDAERELEHWYTWPEWAKDAVVTYTDVTLSWRDVLRIVVRRRCTVTTKVFTTNVVGRTETLSRFSAPPIRPRRPQGVVSVADDPKDGAA